MRGKDEQQLDVFSYVSPEQRVPQDHQRIDDELGQNWMVNAGRQRNLLPDRRRLYRIQDIWSASVLVIGSKIKLAASFSPLRVAILSRTSWTI
jgi:hypothetical protein